MAGGGGRERKRRHFSGPLGHLYTFNRKLPRVFEKDPIQWIPWMYAMWQYFRCNSLVLLVLSFLRVTALALSLAPLLFLVNCCKRLRSKSKPKNDADAGKGNDSSGKNKDQNATENNTGQGSEQAQPPAAATDEEETPEPPESELAADASGGAGPSTVDKEEEKKKEKKIVVLVPSWRKDFVRPGIMVNSSDVFKTEKERERKTFRVVGKEELKKNRIVLPKDWQVVQFSEGFYFIRRRALDMMAKWILECDQEEENVEFVYWNDTSLVGERLTREEAYHKIFSEEYYVAGNSTFGKLSRYPGMKNMKFDIVPSWVRYVEMNRKWWGILSTIPTLLQAGGMLRFSTLLTFILMALDWQRGWLNEAYERVFLWLRLRVKKTNPMSENYLFYFILSQLFSNRWLWYAEKRKKGDYIYLHHFSRISSLKDIEVFGSGYYEPSGSFLLRLWNDNAIGMELPENSLVADARLRKTVFMEYFSTIDTLPMDSRLLRVLSWLKKRPGRVLSWLKRDEKQREEKEKKGEKDKKPSAEEQKPSEEVAEQKPTPEIESSSSEPESAPVPSAPAPKIETEQEKVESFQDENQPANAMSESKMKADQEKDEAEESSDEDTKLPSAAQSAQEIEADQEKDKAEEFSNEEMKQPSAAQSPPETEADQEKDKAEESSDEEMKQPSAAQSSPETETEADQEKDKAEESSDEEMKQPSAAQSPPETEADQEKDNAEESSDEEMKQ